jgi:uncharacterized protein (TIGR02466 family)
MVKSIDLFSFPIYELIIPDQQLIERLINEIKSLSKSSNSLNTTIRVSDVSLNYSFYNKDLFSYLNKGLSEVKSLQYEGDFDFVITECWATRTDKFQKHHAHIHPNSLISGVIYLTNHSDATTEFFLPNPWHWADQFLKIGKENSKIQVASVKPEAGKIVFFPSNLQHSTKPNLNSTPRYTISFNTFISGNIGNHTTLLKVTPVSVESAYNTHSR